MYNYVTVCMSNFVLFFMLSTFQKRESVTLYQFCIPLVSILLRLACVRATYFCDNETRQGTIRMTAVFPKVSLRNSASIA